MFTAFAQKKEMFQIGSAHNVSKVRVFCCISTLEKNIVVSAREP